jgi:hypothetical protein
MKCFQVVLSFRNKDQTSKTARINIVIYDGFRNQSQALDDRLESRWWNGSAVVIVGQAVRQVELNLPG